MGAAALMGMLLPAGHLEMESVLNGCNIQSIIDSHSIQNKSAQRVENESTPILQIHALLRIFHKQTRPKRSGAVGGLARPSEVARVQNIFMDDHCSFSW